MNKSICPPFRFAPVLESKCPDFDPENRVGSAAFIHGAVPTFVHDFVPTSKPQCTRVRREELGAIIVGNLSGCRSVVDTLPVIAGVRL